MGHDIWYTLYDDHPEEGGKEILNGRIYDILTSRVHFNNIDMPITIKDLKIYISKSLLQNNFQEVLWLVQILKECEDEHNITEEDWIEFYHD